MPCASLLIRIVQAACHPNGRPKEVSGHSLCLNNIASSCFMSQIPHVHSGGDALHDSALLDKCTSCVRYVRSVLQAENDVERGFVKHLLNSV